MKKNVKAMALAAALILGGAFILGCSDDDDWISYNEIPETAQKAIEASFGKLDSIKDIKRDDDSYEIYLTDGTKIDFALNGKWKEIDNKAGLGATYFETDPELKKIKAWADAKYKDKTIEEVDRESACTGFEIDFLSAAQNVFVASSAL